MPSPFTLHELLYASEATYAENVTAPSSNTWTKKLPILSWDSDPPTQERGTDGSIQSRSNESRPGFKLGRPGGEIAFTTLWPGHASTTAGALTENWFQDLLSDGLGGSDATQVGGASFISAVTSATQFAQTGGTLVAGGIIRIGIKGDTRGDGQAVVVSDASTVTLMTATAAQVSTADTIYAAMLAYPRETSNVSVSKRFLIGWTDTGAQYHYMGCHLSGLTVTIPMDGSALPTIQWRYQYAYWDKATVAIPYTSLALEEAEAAPFAGGSVFFNTYGTATRAVVNPLELQLTLDIANAVEYAPYAGQAADQTVRAIHRLRCVPTLSMVVRWSTDYDALFTSDGPDTTHKHCLVTCNTTDGRSVGFYLPRIYLLGGKPSIMEHSGLTCQRVTFRGRESALQPSTDLGRAAIKFFTA
jgi:hypothetical protein